MIEANKSAHEHVQTTTCGSEEVVEEIFCEPSLEDPLDERFDQFGGDRDLDKLPDHADTFSEPSLRIHRESILIKLDVIWILTSSSSKL